jgi:transcriptional regulator EpsA
MDAIKATHLIAHGCHDLNGQVTSLFLFACRPETVVPRQSYLVELLLPHLHAAWIRARLSPPAGAPGGSPGSKPAAGGKGLTGRELEILRWVYLGKSNFEIGAILTISALTVKNHVQKILRKLNVVNRTQAVGKAVELRLLDR